MESQLPADIWCKICGVTDVRQAVEVERAGADAIGINFFPDSARYTDIGAAAEMCSALRCQRVGLFVDAEPTTVERTLTRCNLDLLQFHGDERREDCDRWGVPYIKVIRVRAPVSVSALKASYRSAWGFLLDTYQRGRPGGTGETFDWSYWPAHEESDVRLILAGGLNPDNVGAAIEQTKPFGVDVAGGVESSKRTKDIAAVVRFIETAKHASRGRGSTGERSA